MSGRVTVMRRRAALALVALLGVAPALATAQPVAAPEPPLRPGGLSGEAVAERLAPPGVSGWMLADLDTGEVLEAHRAERPFVPASVSKLVTALYALDRLGPGHRFETRLVGGGRVVNGRLGGDLILEGTGDPELDSDALADLVARLTRTGIRSVAGRLLVDGSALGPVAAIAPDQPEDAAYNPGLSGLNLNFNRVRLRWRGRDAPLSVTALGERTDPPVTLVRAERVAGRGLPRLDLGDGGETWRVPAAAMRGRGARWLPVRRPALYAGDVLRQLAGEAGIVLPAPRPGRAPARSAVLARIEGRPLAQVLREMLDYSTNLTAEAVGLAASGPARPAAGQGAIALSSGRMTRWAAHIAGLAPGEPGLAFANHSGLTLESRAAPAAVVALLAAAARHPAPEGAAHPRLPGPAAGLLSGYNVAAESVPLDYDRLDVVAKTGTMDQVRGLAGYIATPKGRRLVFAIFSNRLEARAEDGRRFDRTWMARARNFERALIRNWVGRHDAAAGGG